MPLEQKLSSMPQNLLDREMEKTRAINSNTHALAVALEEEEEEAAAATGKEGRMDGVKQATRHRRGLH